MDQRILVEIFQRCQHRQTTDEFRNETELHQIFRLKFTQHFANAAIVFGFDRCAKADRGLFATGRDDLVETGKGTAADEENVRRIHLQEFLLRMLASACGGTDATVPSMIFRSACCTPSPDTSRVMEGIVRLAGNLVHFVDVDDSRWAR